jgi:hypothetical protein
MAEVLFVMNGECYHKFSRLRTETGLEYIRSLCGLLDSALWNIHIHDQGHWFVKTLRPCKRCYKINNKDIRSIVNAHTNS